MKKLDLCAIYLLIAGVYTLFLLVGLKSPLAPRLMVVIWSLALAGIIFKLTIAHRFKALSLVVVYQLALKLSAGAIIFLLGIIFYVARRVPYNYAI